MLDLLASLEKATKISDLNRLIEKQSNLRNSTFIFPYQNSGRVILLESTFKVVRFSRDGPPHACWPGRLFH